MSQRFLILFSYIGTNYRWHDETIYKTDFKTIVEQRGEPRGMQRLVTRGENLVDFGSVQGVLEFALQKFLRITDARIGIASRTDNGVHAIETAAHFDYNGGGGVEQLSPEGLCHGLNFFLQRNETDIRIRRIVQVPTDFAVRRETFSRTYCYRIAVPHHNVYNSCLNPNSLSSTVSVTELNRVQIVLPPFDSNLILEACKLFLGTWNFKTFSMPTSADKRAMTEKDYTKTVRRMSLTRVNSFIDHSYYLDPLNKEVDFYDFHVEGSGFLRRQVRRMIGSLLAVGAGHISEKEIRFMLEHPNHQNWNNKCNSTIADGLYLKSVNIPSVPVIRGPLSLYEV